MILFRSLSRSTTRYIFPRAINFSTLLTQFPPGTDAFAQPKILSECFKYGEIKHAEELFDTMPQRNVVPWSIMVHGYAKNGLYFKSIEFFSRMQVSGFVPNSFTFVGILVAASGLQDLLLGKCVHGVVVKSGLESDSIVGTAMLDTYAKCGSVLDSYTLFEGLDNPSLVTCNALISGFSLNELFEETVSLFNWFRRSSVVPSSVMVLNVIRSSVAFGSNLCESVHGFAMKFGLHSNLYVCNSLLYMYSNLVDLDATMRFFYEMKYKDVVSWTTVLGLLVRLEHARDAVIIYQEMRCSGVDQDDVVLQNLIMTCACLGDLKRGREVHAQAVISGFGSKLNLTNSIVSLYIKCGDLDSSRALFERIDKKSLVSWTAMITGYLQNGYPSEALSLINRLRSEGTLCFDSVILVSVLAASGELALLEFCQQLHAHSIEASFINYQSVQNTLISAYAKCGCVEHASKIFYEMGFDRNVVSWNAIINGYGVNGHGERAVALFQEMINLCVDPDRATYLSVLSACSHSGLVDDGLLIFQQIAEEDRIKLNQEHLGCIIDLLARSTCLSDANGLASKALKVMGANACRAFLSGCSLHCNVELAELIARKLFELDPGDPSQVVLLSNVYASVGRFHDAEVLRQSLSNNGRLKNPGISLLN